jgi:outer membrane protein assembly factor BamB
MYRHDQQGTGTTTNPALSNSLIWHFSTRDKIRSSPAIANGIVYQGSNDGNIYAINATNGSLIGNTTRSQIESSPAWQMALYSSDYCGMDTTATCRFERSQWCFNLAI